MDSKKNKNNVKDFVCGTPTSAFTRYVRDPPTNEVNHAQDHRIKRKSAFACIKQLFSLQSSDTAST
jgi:hypothetical protein